ncbi:hypothetical protein [Sphingomonas sp. UYEF23]|uniref:hypothetical protein n=1 Tax=Sphingomonas sp. UYEF23 TaxID=1756408 RepID=UPI003399D92E
MYDIRFDATRRVFVITSVGFWTLGTLASFSAATVAQGMAMRVRYGPYAVLNDARDYPIQSSQVAHGLELLMAQSLKITSGPVVTVVNKALNKMQAERVLNAPNSRVFLDWDEANAWLEQEWVSKRTT